MPGVKLNGALCSAWWDVVSIVDCIFDSVSRMHLGPWLSLTTQRHSETTAGLQASMRLVGTACQHVNAVNLYIASCVRYMSCNVQYPEASRYETVP